MTTSLLIDNSNSRTKFALAQNGKLTDWSHIIPTPEISPETLQRGLQGITFDHATLCSVVPPKQPIFQEYIGDRLHTVSAESNLGMDISYPTPKEIGADRLANGVAAFQKYGNPAIVIDSGTAVTFDVIDENGTYAGGVIAPGLNLLTEYFPSKTALLPQIELCEPSSFIGQSTKDAMNIGAVSGFRGLIREILTGIINELPQPPHIIATGGDAQLLYKGIKRINAVDPRLTLEGILHISELNHR